MENEIFEVEIELGNGEKQTMEVELSEDWSDIQPGTKALMVLINQDSFLVIINSADEDEGVSFKIIGENRSYHHEGSVVARIFTEVIK